MESEDLCCLMNTAELEAECLVVESLKLEVGGSVLSDISSLFDFHDPNF